MVIFEVTLKLISSLANLVINVCDIHNVEYIEIEVVFENTSKNIKRNI